MSTTATTEHDIEKTRLSDTASHVTSKDPNVVDFDGPDDPENPMNWSSTKKTVAITIVTAMTLLS